MARGQGEKGLCALLHGHHGAGGSFSACQSVGPRPSLRMQAWPWLAFLPALVLPVLALRMMFLPHLTLCQIKLFSGSAGDAPSLTLAHELALH